MCQELDERERILAETNRWVIIEEGEEVGDGALRIIHKVDGLDVCLSDDGANVLQVDSSNGTMVVGEHEAGGPAILIVAEKE